MTLSQLKMFDFQERLLKVLKCYNFVWVQRWYNCPTASFANCIMTLYLLKVRLQTFLSIPITQKCQILSCDTCRKWMMYRSNGWRQLRRPLKRLLDKGQTGLLRPNRWRMMMMMIWYSVIHVWDMLSGQLFIVMLCRPGNIAWCLCQKLLLCTMRFQY